MKNEKALKVVNASMNTLMGIAIAISMALAVASLIIISYMLYGIGHVPEFWYDTITWKMSRVEWVVVGAFFALTIASLIILKMIKAVNKGYVFYIFVGNILATVAWFCAEIYGIFSSNMAFSISIIAFAFDIVMLLYFYVMAKPFIPNSSPAQ